jgi:hypothetical protein
MKLFNGVLNTKYFKILIFLILIQQSFQDIVDIKNLTNKKFDLIKFNAALKEIAEEVKICKKTPATCSDFKELNVFFTKENLNKDKEDIIYDNLKEKLGNPFEKRGKFTIEYMKVAAIENLFEIIKIITEEGKILKLNPLIFLKPEEMSKVLGLVESNEKDFESKNTFNDEKELKDLIKYIEPIDGVDSDEFIEEIKKEKQLPNGNSKKFFRFAERRKFNNKIKNKNKSRKSFFNLVKYLPKIGKQGDCGSCWAFANSGVLTALYHRYQEHIDSPEKKDSYKDEDPISSQFMIDCINNQKTIYSHIKTNSCCGGYTKEIGESIINLKQNYFFPRNNQSPYLNKDKDCSTTDPLKPIIHINKCSEFPLSEPLAPGAEIKDYINLSEIVDGFLEFKLPATTKPQDFSLFVRKWGPLVVGVSFPKDKLREIVLFDYKSDFLKLNTIPSNSRDVYRHHMILYSYNKSQNYWALRNSWGKYAPTIKISAEGNVCNWRQSIGVYYSKHLQPTKK